MISRYSIIKYVPNPINVECINIGVIAFNEDEVQVRFLSDWSRVEVFGGEDITFLKDFARRMEIAVSKGLMFPGDEEDGRPRHERLDKIVKGWMNSIQFTNIHPSLASVSKLLEDCMEEFLVEPELLKEIEQAKERYILLDKIEPKAKSIHVNGNELTLVLETGVRVQCPNIKDVLRRLKDVTQEQLENVCLHAGGTVITWEELDEDIEVIYFLLWVIGSREWANKVMIALDDLVMN